MNFFRTTAVATTFIVLGLPAGCEGTNMGNPAGKTPGFDCDPVMSEVAGSEVIVPGQGGAGGASGLTVDAQIAALEGEYETEMDWLRMDETADKTSLKISIEGSGPASRGEYEGKYCDDPAFLLFPAFVTFETGDGRFIASEQADVRASDDGWTNVFFRVDLGDLEGSFDPSAHTNEEVGDDSSVSFAFDIHDGELSGSVSVRWSDPVTDGEKGSVGSDSMSVVALFGQDD